MSRDNKDHGVGYDTWVFILGRYKWHIHAGSWSLVNCWREGKTLPYIGCSWILINAAVGHMNGSALMVIGVSAWYPDTYYTALKSYGHFLYHFSPATSECTPPTSPFQPPAAPAGHGEGMAVNRGFIVGPRVPTHIILHQIPEEKNIIDNKVHKNSAGDSGILADDPTPANTAPAQVIPEMEQILDPVPSTSSNVGKSPMKPSRKNPIVKLIRL